MNMTLEQAIATLTVAENQQMSGRVEEAIRIVLDNMKKRVEVVRCRDCEHRHTNDCSMVAIDYEEEEFTSWEEDDDFCSYGERKL